MMNLNMKLDIQLGVYSPSGVYGISRLDINMRLCSLLVRFPGRIYGIGGSTMDPLCLLLKKNEKEDLFDSPDYLMCRWRAPIGDLYWLRRREYGIVGDCSINIVIILHAGIIGPRDWITICKVRRARCDFSWIPSCLRGQRYFFILS